MVEADLLAPGTRKLLSGGGFDLGRRVRLYYPVGHGGINPDSEEAIARHELRLPLPKLVGAAKRLVGFRGRLRLCTRRRGCRNCWSPCMNITCRCGGCGLSIPTSVSLRSG